MTSLVCERHPERPAEAACVECGALVCAACRNVDEAGLTLCPVHGRPSDVGAQEMTVAGSPLAGAPVEPPSETPPTADAPDAGDLERFERTLDQAEVAHEVSGEPPGPAPDEPTACIPWESPASLSTFSRLLSTARFAAYAPLRFMEHVPWARGDLRTPLICALLAHSFGRVVDVAWLTLLPDSFSIPLAWLDIPGMGAVTNALLNLPMVPLFVALQILLSASVLHLVLKAFGAARRPFEATLRVYAYAEISACFLALPFFGLMAATGLKVVLVMNGLRAAHGVAGFFVLVGLAPVAWELARLLQRLLSA